MEKTNKKIREDLDQMTRMRFNKNEVGSFIGAAEVAWARVENKDNPSWKLGNYIQEVDEENANQLLQNWAKVISSASKKSSLDVDKIECQAKKKAWKAIGRTSRCPTRLDAGGVSCLPPVVQFQLR